MKLKNKNLKPKLKSLHKQRLLHIKRVFMASTPCSSATALATYLAASPDTLSFIETPLFLPGKYEKLDSPSWIKDVFKSFNTPYNKRMSDMESHVLESRVRCEGPAGVFRHVIDKNKRFGLDLAVINKHPAYSPWANEIKVDMYIVMDKHPFNAINECRKRFEENKSLEPGINWCSNLPEKCMNLSRLERAAHEMAMCSLGIKEMIEKSSKPKFIVSYEEAFETKETLYKTLRNIWDWMGVSRCPYYKLEDIFSNHFLSSKPEVWRDELSEETRNMIIDVYDQYELKIKKPKSEQIVLV